MSMVKINWKPTATELRKFGVVMIIGFGLIGLLVQFKLHKPAPVYQTIYAIGAIAGLLGLTGTKAALPVYWAWMAIAYVMGNIMSRLVLVVFYYLIVTPTSLLMRLTGRDKLLIRPKKCATYWQECSPLQDSRHERQF